MPVFLPAGDVLLLELGPSPVPCDFLPCPPPPSIARSGASVGVDGYGQAGEVGVGRRGRRRRATAAARAMDEQAKAAGWATAGEQAKAAAGRAGYGGRGRHRRPCRPRRARVVSAGEQAKARAGAGGVVLYDQGPGLIRRRDLYTSRSRELLIVLE